MAVRIDSFKERLDEHFASEEDGGLLQGLQDALPQAESDVKRIRAQHTRMREALDAVRAIARRGRSVGSQGSRDRARQDARDDPRARA
jgi:hypothetical protein